MITSRSKYCCAITQGMLIASLVLAARAQSGNRVVYAQAVLGSSQNQTYEIELRLANKDAYSPWTGAIRLLRNQDLAGMTDVLFTAQNGFKNAPSNGELVVTIPARQSMLYTITSTRFQTGVLVIDSSYSSVENLVPSLYYRLHDSGTGLATDLIAVQPSGTASSIVHTMIALDRSFNIGIALVPEKSLARGGSTPAPTRVTLTATGDDGSQVTGSLLLGNTEAAQKAFFPNELLALPPEFKAARLKIEAGDPLYNTVLGVGFTPDFQSVQMAGTPAFSETPRGQSRMVYPQAVVGELQGLGYEIELRLGNRNPSREWAGALRLLRQQDLQPMTGVRQTDKDGKTTPLAGSELPIRLGPGRSMYTRLTGSELQIGVLVIDSAATSLDELLPAFYYRIVDRSSGRISDLIAIQAAEEPGLAANMMIAQTAAFNAGIAIVAENSLGRPPQVSKPIPVSLTVILDNGSQVTGGILLGGGESAQKALFPGQAIAGLPPEVRVSRLLIASPEKIYTTTLGIGSPPLFENVQMGAAPTLAESTRNVPLRVLGGLKGILLGAAVQPARFQESDYSQTLAREMSIVTPENDMKFGPIHPQPTSYSFANADAIVNFAQARGIQVRGHTLVWHSQLPAWITSRTWTREDLMAVLREHITTVMGRYKNKVSCWDVVNEAIDDQGQLRSTVWSQAIGPDYIELAFRWANEADPQARLFYNDYSAEGLGAKSDAVYALVKGLLQKGIPIHGVGFQSHFILTSPPRIQDIASNMNRIAALGLDVHFTELDIRIPEPFTSAKLTQQADVYRSVGQACVSAPNCRAFILWGFTDKYSWIPGFFPGYGAALPFDGQYLPKAAYYGLSDALAGIAPSK